MVSLDFYPESDNLILKTKKALYSNLSLKNDPLLAMVLLQNEQDPETLRIAEPSTLEALIAENITSQSVNLLKREVLGEDFTDEDYAKLCSKLIMQNDQFKKHQVRDVGAKIERVKATFNRLTFEEIFFALKSFDYNEDEVAIYLTKNEFIAQIRCQIAQTYHERKPQTPSKEISESENSDLDEELLEQVSSSDDSDSESGFKSESESKFNNNSNKRKLQSSSAASSASKKISRLRLDDALANVTDMEGWSEARIRAYQGMSKNPNAYYYRFNAPGETQKNGPWSKEEEDLFMRRLAEFGADGQWGIFSMAIPGRVGYQCSNYYRKLIEIGRIKDSNYKIDDKGKAHYIGGKTRAVSGSHSKIHNSIEITFDNDSEESSEESDDDSETVNIKKGNILAFNHHNTHENPLPGFIDAITQSEVVRPAISPYGHVLSYDTWIKCLINGDRKNTCPLTNQPLHKRQLVFLTFENIEMYRDQIRQVK